MDYYRRVESRPLVTVVETPEFIARATRLLTDDEREALIFYLAASPMAGAVIPGAGGIRKLRWRLEGRGKRGGARVIYFFHNADMPVFALTLFAKNERADLSHRERNELRQLCDLLVERYRRARP